MRVSGVMALSTASSGYAKSLPAGTDTTRAPMAWAVLRYGSNAGCATTISGAPDTAVSGAPSSTSASGVRWPR